jgi:apolipoprotein N-acyltransferase
VEQQRGPGPPRRGVRHVARSCFTIIGVYAALSVMWLLIDLADDSSGFWFYWPMLGTGIGVAVAAVFLLGVGGLFGGD